MMEPRLYCCFHCRNIVSCHEDIMSKTFVGFGGRAFLFSHAMNILVGPKREANLITGRHVIADISCSDCEKTLGWKYELAVPESEKYKEGKFVFVNKYIVKANWY
ncbi:hypothetical protein MKX01_009594 [Papaver californicum]|nr:hypothetical protein MKX01_009594 [Papaver californicum]